jgi:hypothetical protein
MPTLPNMNLITPTDHGSDDVWDTILDATFALIDEHDHTTGKGVQIPSGGLSIDADVPWNSGGSYYALTGVKALDFQPSATAGMTGYACALFANSADNELYWRTSGGSNVKLTAGTSLNVSAFAGGVGGDYSAVSALIDYDDATDTYRFRQEVATAVRQYAKLASADLKLFEYFAAGATPVPANAVTLKSPAALAANIAVTMFPSLPSRTSPVVMSSAGALTADDTARVLRVPGALSAETGTAEVHQRTNFGWLLNAAVSAIIYPIPITEGAQITQWKLWCRKTTTGADTITAQFFKYDATSSTQTQIGVTQTNNANNPGFISLGQSGLTEVIGASDGLQYYVVFTSGGATAANHFVMHLDVFVKRG